MHSKPKKVIHSLKESLLRIALVHSSVSFKIVDIESEDDVLCTHASSSLLPLLSSEFGIYQSEVDLLCTHASPSPLPLLSSGLGFIKVRLTCFAHVLLLLHCHYCPVGLGLI